MMMIILDHIFSSLLAFSLISSVDGEDKHGGITRLATINPMHVHSLTNQLASFSSLLLTLSSPYGDYQPFRVPILNTMDPKQTTVNYVVEAEDELEQQLEEVIELATQTLHISSKRRFTSMILTQSVDVENTIKESRTRLTIHGGLTFTNHTQIPILIRCWLGDKLVYAVIINAFGKQIAPPYASHVPYLFIQLFPLTSKNEQMKGKEHMYDPSYHLDGFVFSAMEVEGKNLSEFNNVYHSYRSDICECDDDDDEILAEMDEVSLIVSASKQLHGRYEIAISPPITLQNCLPIPLAVTCACELAPLPLFADTCLSTSDKCCVLPPLAVMPLYTHLRHRHVAMAPAHMRCEQSVPLRTMCEEWLPWLEEGIVSKYSSSSSSTARSTLAMGEEDSSHPPSSQSSLHYRTQENNNHLPHHYNDNNDHEEEGEEERNDVKETRESITRRMRSTFSSSSTEMDEGDEEAYRINSSRRMTSTTATTMTTVSSSTNKHPFSSSTSHHHHHHHHRPHPPFDHANREQKGEQQEEVRLIPTTKMADSFIKCYDYDNTDLSLTCRCEWKEGHLIISVFVPFWLDLPASIPLRAQVFTNKEKDVPLPNQHFLHSENALIRFYDGVLPTSIVSMMSAMTATVPEREVDENRVLLIDGKHVRKIIIIIIIIIH